MDHRDPAAPSRNSTGSKEEMPPTPANKLDRCWLILESRTTHSMNTPIVHSDTAHNPMAHSKPMSDHRDNPSPSNLTDKAPIRYRHADARHSRNRSRTASRHNHRDRKFPE